MWEAIAQNKRRSWLLIGVMGVLLLGLGYVIGSVIYLQVFPYVQFGGIEGVARSSIERAHQPDGPEPVAWIEQLLNTGGYIGAAVAAAIWLIMTLVALAGGDSLLLHTAKAYRIEKEDSPRLWNVVEEMTIASGLGKMPRVYIIDNDLPNAFAVGKSQDQAAVAVTSGLLKRLTRDELQGVIAHEVGHIRNLDVRFMTIAAVMVGSIVLMSEFFLYYLWFGGGRRSSSRKGGGQLAIILLVVGIIAAIAAPVMARMLYFACSRKREYLADASAAQFTRFPDGLAAALEKIAGQPAAPKSTSRTMLPLYIINPLQTRAAVGMFSTHPPTHTRVKILRSMGGGAGFAEYEQAYRKLHGQRSHCLGSQTLSHAEGLTAREPTPEPKRAKEQAIERARDVAGLLDRMTNFIGIACVCGVNLKIPPSFNRPSLRCPRCGRQHDVPKAKGTAKKNTPAEKGLTYKRKGTGWESFKCSCGAVIQLSPSFSAKFTSCRKCSRHIKIT